MVGQKVVSITNRREDQGAKECVVYFRLQGNDIQFKFLSGHISEPDKGEVAEACEAVAKYLRKPKY